MINCMNKKKYSIQLLEEGKPSSMLQPSVFSGFNKPLPSKQGILKVPPADSNITGTKLFSGKESKQKAGQ